MPIHLHLARLVVTDVEIPVQDQPRFGRAKVEQDEFGLRERRSYAEVAGTEAGNIIADAGGPLPFPPLTPTQEQVVAERARDRRVDPVVAQASAEVAALPPGVAYATAKVHRG